MVSSAVSEPAITDSELLAEFDRNRAALKASGLLFEDYPEYEFQLEELYKKCFNRLRGFYKEKKKPEEPPPTQQVQKVSTLRQVPGYMHVEVLGILQKREKAVLFKLEGGDKQWFPRSVIDGRFLKDHHILLVKDWFAQKEGIV